MNGTELSEDAPQEITDADSSYYPELVLCLCAAVGTDTTVVSEAFASELLAVGYHPIPVRLSALMAQIPDWNISRILRPRTIAFARV